MKGRWGKKVIAREQTKRKEEEVEHLKGKGIRKSFL